MNNYYNGYEDHYFHGYYENTYSLWQNSRYYDTNNLSPRNYSSNEWNISEQQSEILASIEFDEKNRRVIKRDDLYRDPDLFEDIVQQGYQGSSSFGWPHQDWVKAGESSQDPKEGTSGNSKKTSNKVEKLLNKALKQPVKMTKAESMMQKMGWQGGALGKSGDGIIEPIHPNAAYATKTIGLGLRKQADKQKNKKGNHSKENKNHFDTNVLQNLLRFVKNDCESEMVFDKTLWKEERKRVHNLVNDVIMSEGTQYVDSEGQADILGLIKHHNCYVLGTQSIGEVPDRQLTVYKEAPTNVYLISPDDLREKYSDEPEEEDTVDVDESNPFLKSINKNIKEDINNKLDQIKSSLDIIVEYFADFQGSEEFTELRFVGPFSVEEIDAINKFFNDLTSCIEGSFSEVGEDLEIAFKESTTQCKILQDVNGSAVIHKVKGDIK